MHFHLLLAVMTFFRIHLGFVFIRVVARCFVRECYVFINLKGVLQTDLPKNVVATLLYISSNKT